MEYFEYISCKVSFFALLFDVPQHRNEYLFLFDYEHILCFTLTTNSWRQAQNFQPFGDPVATEDRTNCAPPSSPKTGR